MKYEKDMDEGKRIDEVVKVLKRPFDDQGEEIDK